MSKFVEALFPVGKDTGMRWFNVYVARDGEHIPSGNKNQEAADFFLDDDRFVDDKGAYRIVVKPKGEMK